MTSTQSADQDGHERKEAAKAALAKLGEARFSAFIKAALQQKWHPHAVEYMHRELQAGHRPDEIFSKGDQYGYLLDVSAEGKAVYLIDFGCQAGPRAGDGGSWRVAFDEAGQVLTVEAREQWVS